MNVPSTKATFFRFQPARPSQSHISEPLVSSQHSQNLRPPTVLNESTSVSGQDTMRSLRQDFLSTINTFMQSNQLNTGKLIDTLKLAGSQQQDDIQNSLRALHEDMSSLHSSSIKQFEIQREHLRASLSEVRSLASTSSSRVLNQTHQKCIPESMKRKSQCTDQTVAKRFKRM